jgi:hypothetical protein
VNQKSSPSPPGTSSGVAGASADPVEATRPVVLVIGATGQIGGALVDLLKGDASVELRAAVRRPEQAERLAAEGVRSVHLDLDDYDGFAAAFEGVGRLHRGHAGPRQERRGLSQSRRGAPHRPRRHLHPARSTDGALRGAHDLAPAAGVLHRSLRSGLHPPATQRLHAGHPRRPGRRHLPRQLGRGGRRVGGRSRHRPCGRAGPARSRTACRRQLLPEQRGRQRGGDHTDDLGGTAAADPPHHHRPRRFPHPAEDDQRGAPAASSRR